MREGFDPLRPSGGIGTATGTGTPADPLTRISCAFAPALGWKARIGLIVLSSDHTIEFEWRGLMADAAAAEGPLESVAVYAARIPNDPSISTESLGAMEARVTDTADLLLPGMPFDVVAYGCTAASMLIGPDRVRALIQAVRPGVAVTEPVSAARAAFEALGVRRLAMLTPYMPAVDAQLAAGFEAGGLELPVRGSFTLESDNDAARIGFDSLYETGLALAGGADVDGLFVSCTSLHMMPILDRLEAALGKPVISSNQALAWHALRLAGIDKPLAGYGRLFREA